MWAALLEVSGRLPRADRRRPVTAGRASAGRRGGGQGTASPVPRLPWSCSDRAVPSGPDRGPRSLPDPRPSAALTGPSVLPLSFAGSTRSPSRGGGAAALQVWPEVAKAVGPFCACQVRGSRRRVTPALGGPRSRRGPCGPHGGASGVPSVPAAEAAGPRATVLGPPLAGRSRLTHTEQVCCQRAFQVSTWRPFPRRGRGRPATPPSVSPQTRGRGAGPPARHEPLGTARRLAASHRPGRARHGSEARCTLLLHDVKPFHVC